MRMNYVDGLQFLKDNQIYKPDGTTYEYGDVRNIIINFMRPQNTKSTNTSLMIYVGGRFFVLRVHGGRCRLNRTFPRLLSAV